MAFDDRIVFRHPDGRIEITNCAAPPLEGESEKDYRQRIHNRTKEAVPHLASATWVATIPAATHNNADRYFRGAWAWVTDDPVIDIDMAKAREVHKDKLRDLRAPRFEPLERAQRAALAKDDTATAQKAEVGLQALRDVTDDPAIEAARTPEELKTIIPAALRD